MKNRKLHSFATYACSVLLALVMTSTFVSCSDDDGDDDGGGATLTITSLTPATARAGESVTIAGTGFNATPSQNTVTFKGAGASGVPAMVQEASATALKVAVPANAATGAITVTVAGKSVTSSQTFTIDESLGAPVLTSLNPTSGFINAEITITGSSFGTNKNVIDVLFGDVEATEIVSVTATTVIVKVPTSLAPGAVAVKVVRDGITSATSLQFTVNATPTSVKTVYWSDSFGIFRGVIDDGGVTIEELYNDSGRTPVQGVAIDEERGYIYWGHTGGVSRALLDGTGTIEDVYSDDVKLTSVYDVAIDHAGGNIYFTSYDANFEHSYIHKGNLDGSVDYTTLVEQGLFLLGDNLKLTVANNMLYWSSRESKHVARASLTGTFTAEIIYDAADGLKGPAGVAVHPESGRVFITDNAGGAAGESKIWQGSLDGKTELSTFVPVGNNVLTPYDAEIDFENGYFFWLNNMTDAAATSDLMRVKLDGTNVEKLFSGIENGNSFDISVR
ncbi:IPT/TIG domain-containing protein [Fulvivirgaceae bacterium PWU5]|uniref:IPT/TIG domain-containing protein n=1 Tax=Dawidia cretensis TaxID=2782350 RepID=A0AAP2GT23_9BACT|nr:IPT/TIG domain-containing protein [Dawidia cretensis]MBT1712421.1 IPT/TIG domain-containing protein [Dawidia cretensis]